MIELKFTFEDADELLRQMRKLVAAQIEITVPEQVNSYVGAEISASEGYGASITPVPPFETPEETAEKAKRKRRTKAEIAADEAAEAAAKARQGESVADTAEPESPSTEAQSSPTAGGTAETAFPSDDSDEENFEAARDNWKASDFAAYKDKYPSAEPDAGTFMRVLLQRVVDKIGMDAAREFMVGFGYGRVSEIPKDRRDDFYAAVIKIISA